MHLAREHYDVALQGRGVGLRDPERRSQAAQHLALAQGDLSVVVRAFERRAIDVRLVA